MFNVQCQIGVKQNVDCPKNEPQKIIKIPFLKIMAYRSTPTGYTKYLSS